MPDLADDALKTAARHRGLKLVKSRKRKPGVSDYGRYGLADAAGRALFGFEGDALTATAAMIADYLREAGASTWQQSASVTPDRPRPAAPADAGKSRGGDASERSRPSRPERRRDRGASKITADAGDAPAVTPRPPVVAKPEPDPAPVLSIRPAGAGDAPLIGRLLARTGAAPANEDLAAFLVAAKRAGSPVLIATMKDIGGCLAWHLIPTLQGGAIGRITLLLVAEPDRRKRIGSALLEAGIAAMAGRGCSMIETMSEMAVRNASGFWRAGGFEQSSYRFTRALASERTHAE